MGNLSYSVLYRVKYNFFLASQQISLYLNRFLHSPEILHLQNMLNFIISLRQGHVLRAYVMEWHTTFHRGSKSCQFLR